ncbi:MAG TPA: NigD-like C-terminal domain-containing protein [Mariniphaga sp.]|nr:NigD-like C-terminal domain-containing protein [Mariniphaga sp.]
MKKIILFISVVFLLAACQKEEEPAIKQAAGHVLNYAGANHCSIIIELENGKKIIPMQYPTDFKFYHGQQLLITYAEIPNVISTCDKGVSSTVYNIEELSPGPAIVDLHQDEMEGLPNTPVILHNVTVEDGFLKMKVSFSGGCRNHTFNLINVEGEEQTEDTAILMLHHDSNDDMCEAALTMDLKFDISSLSDQGYTSFFFKALLLDGEIHVEQFDIES